MRWHFGSVTFSEYDEDGFLGVQCDVFGEIDSGMPPFESLGTYGFANRPPDPGDDGASTVLYFYKGDQAFAIPFGDPRRTPSLPPLKKGSSLQYCDRPSFDMHDGEDGTKTVYVEYPDGSTAHLFTIGFDANGEPVIELIAGSGAGLSIIDGRVTLRNDAGDGYLEVGPNETINNGSLKVSGDVKTSLPGGIGISLEKHTHITPFGPTSQPVPTP